MFDNKACRKLAEQNHLLEIHTNLALGVLGYYVDVMKRLQDNTDQNDTNFLSAAHDLVF